MVWVLLAVTGRQTNLFRHKCAGKWLTGGWDPKFNPDLLKYTEIKGQLGISKEMLPG